MKKIVLALALMFATLAAGASNTLYFTYNQALRTVTLLNNQDELMIYCGYADELPTYVLLNEVWAEQISSSFYEIWLYGYDAYTGEEVYMPIDLECIWLVKNGHIYSAAQTLRFRSSHARPTFAWSIPRYNPYVRAHRPPTFYYSYHYDIHRPGWHWRHHPHAHYHPYYMRPPSKPAPLPPAPFTPGHDKPGYKTTTSPNGEIGYEYIPSNTTGNIAASRSQTIVKNDPTSRAGNRITSDRSGGTVTTADRITGNRSTVNAPEVGRGTQENSRGTSTGTRSNDNSRGTSTGTRSNDNSRGTSTGTRSNDNSRGTSTGTRSNSSQSSATSTNTNTRGTSTGTRSNSNQSSATGTNTNTRGTSTGTRSNSSQSSATSTNNNSRGTSTGTRSNSNQSSATSSNSNTRGTSTGTRSNDNSRGTSTGTRSNGNSRGTSTGTRK